MPFRAKFKKALGGGNPSSDDSEVPNKSFLNKTSAHRPLTKSELKAWPKNVYKPGEVMPRPKYRGPWNQAHQDKLSAFSFGSSSRRRSSATVRTGSEYSPMGSKLPSRGQSRRNSSISWSSLTGRKRPPLESREASGFGHEDRVDENGEADDDVGNVGLSRQQTAERHRRLPQQEQIVSEDEGMDDLAVQKTISNGRSNGFLSGFADELENQRTITNGRLFTEEELANALTASTLKPSRRERE